MIPPPKAGPPASDSAARRGPRVGGLSGLTWALAALVAGLVAGVLLHGSARPWVGKLAEVLVPIGQIWLAALRVAVVPLVITQTLVAVVAARGESSIVAIGGRALLLFLVMLIAAGLFAFALAPPLVSLYPVSAETAASLRAGTSIPPSALEETRRDGPSVGAWLVGLVPKNIVQAASSGEILPVLLFSVFFGLAVTHLAPAQRDLLGGVFRALADAMMVLVQWVMKAAPAGVFALTFDLGLRTGLPLAGFAAAFVALLSFLILLFTGLLYPATALLARISIGRFARAAAPAQLVAVSTRSSLASLPALVEGARDRLALPAYATGFVLPLSVSVFKQNQPISGLVKLLFLAHAFHVRVGLPQVATFFVTLLVMSFSAVGIPGGGGAIRLLPAYLAAGVPIEGVVILEALDTIPDIFKTLLNVTGDLSAAAILSRFHRAPPA